ncbi:hypothetical protein SAY87_027507 [Trapa incisa]|uniref:Branched-chain-amino-acid aminotransferase n=1 Tax=Trapa incisa TaxID=236973 RepID=A0AAN7JMJ1_9MYRT|nr:hypothetical protein SAY87_027507 [Trapa incisa]
MSPSVHQTADEQPAIGSHSNSEKYADVNWDELGFSLIETDFMYVMKCSIGESFQSGSIAPFGNLELSPCCTLLNYGQGLFEGLKAYRKEDGKVQLFRPEQNALRMQTGAERLCMPSPSVEQFLHAVKQTVIANKRWVPPPGRGSMYIRPLLMGMGPALGLGPSPNYMFLVFASPVGDYYDKGGKSMNLLVEDKHRRASPGGTGSIKTVANYSPVLNAQARAKAQGFSDVLFLDAATGKYIEEVSACNIFIVKDKVISTPETAGTILPGITRKSIIQLALMLGYKVEERLIPVEELLDADEVFCTGTAVVVTPVSSVTHQGRRVEYKQSQGETPVNKKLCKTLTGIQMGRIDDKMGWMVQVD